MNKKIIIGLVALIILGVGYYLLSPLWNNKELSEASPIVNNTSQVTPKTEKVVIKDNFDSMPFLIRGEFEKQTIVMKDKVIVKEESMPTGQPRIVAQADFKPRAHDVTGKALLIEQNGQYTVRFENFETINGPDIDIYLSSELGGNDYINLGDIKATKGNVNYSVPAGTDINKYNKVLVWCKAFSVLFSYAELK